MKNLSQMFFGFILMQFVTCCPQKDYDKILLEPFENAGSILTTLKATLLKYQGQKTFNYSGLEDFILQLGKDELSAIARNEERRVARVASELTRSLLWKKWE